MDEQEKKPGRPEKPIDWVQFEKLCAMFCTHEEICAWFQITPKTLETRCKKQYGQTFYKVYKEKSAMGKASLRRKQMELAMRGDKTMLIWLGKNNLGQVDSIEHRIALEEQKVKALSTDELIAQAKEVLPLLVIDKPKDGSGGDQS